MTRRSAAPIRARRRPGASPPRGLAHIARRSFRGVSAVPVATTALALVLVLLSLIAAQPVAAQEPSDGDARSSADAEDTARGWIGIAFRNPAGGRGRPAPDGPGVRISGVLRGSPADRAGIRPGEVLVRMDGEALGPGELEERARGIRVGDTLVLGLRGPYGQRDVALVAGPPPADPPFPDARVMARMDSIESAVRRRLDSLRARMRVGRGDSAPWPPRSFRLMEEDRRPPESPDRPGARDGEPPARLPPRPHTLGADFVAGARMVDLNPSLAEYFQVDGGVLTVQVLEESPAEEGGLLPGDVVIAVGDRTIGSVGELRRALLERAAGGAVLRVIRRGEELRIPLS